MPKKQRVRTFMDTQHVKGSETLVQSAQQYLGDIFDHSERNSASKILFQ